MVDRKPPASSEYAAIVRIDAQPSGKKFQGVWLDFGGDRRWVIAYRPHQVWRVFEGAEVRVTGHCYQPFGQAIGATHFEVETMTFASAPKLAVPFFTVGPRRLLRGSFIGTTAPAGSKLAGSVTTEFQPLDGMPLAIAGSDDPITRTGAVAIIAREVERNLAYTATTGGAAAVWIVSVHDADYTPEPSRDTPKACP
jgi:hypothetical protein